MNKLPRLMKILIYASLMGLTACGTRATPLQGDTPSSPPASSVAPKEEATLSPTVLPTQKGGAVLPNTAGSGCPVTDSAPASETSRLTLSPGPGIPESTAKGERLILVGTIYARDCTPVPGASLEVWQTDGNGEYGPGHGTDNMRCCFYQGTVQTDASGAYQLVTVKPGYYKGAEAPPPAHIHVSVSLPGNFTGAKGQGTEIVFAEDPHLPANAEQLDYTIVRLEKMQDSEGEYWYGVADIVLPAEPKKKPVSIRSFTILAGESEASYHITEKFADLATLTNAAGVTSLVEGSIMLELSSPAVVQAMTMTVDLRGLKSNDPSRDEKLADRWLVTNRYPSATFVSTGVRDFPGKYQEGKEVSFLLEGNLSIRDITRPVVFQVHARLVGDTLAGSASAQIRMSDYGIDPPSLLGFVVVEDEVEITIRITAVE